MAVIHNKRVVTQNLERKLKKKIRNARTDEDRQLWENELSIYQSRKIINESFKKQ